MASAVNEFSDLPKTHWAYDYVMALAERGIVNGISLTEFVPDANVTREQFAKMMVEALELCDENAICDFPDMPDGKHWAYQYVAGAVQAGLIKGYDTGEFGAGRSITRQEMAVMVVRGIVNRPKTAELKAAELTTELTKDLKTTGARNAEPLGFTDEAEIGEWAREAVTKMQQAGIIRGFEDGTFRPGDNATRAQAAKIICGMLLHANDPNDNDN
jgi:hypothetical protein